jgi:hypothetical protein
VGSIPTPVIPGIRKSSFTRSSEEVMWRALLAGAILVGWTAIAPAAYALQADSDPVALAIADDYRVPGLDARRFTHAELWSVLDDALQADEAGRLRVTELGRSVEGRAIRAISFGSGPTSALLWSQMHGDESTATMALADLIRYLEAGSDDGGDAASAGATR